MSVTTIRTIFCDRRAAVDCRFWAFQSPNTAAILRHWAREVGWKVGLPGGEDVCPACLSHVVADDAPRAIIVL